MSNSFLNFMLIYNLCPKTNLSTGQNFSDLSTTSATYRPKYELEILSRALYKLFWFCELEILTLLTSAQGHISIREFTYLKNRNVHADEREFT